MTTAGTLHDEALRLGPGRLLAAYVTTTPVASIGISLPGPQSKYDCYMLDISSILPQNADTSHLVMRFSIDGGATWVATADYWYSQLFTISHGTAPYGGMNGAAADRFYINGPQPKHLSLAAEVLIDAVGNSPPFVKSFSSGWQSQGAFCRNLSCQAHPNINALLLFYESDNIARATVHLYGIRKGVV